jgi:hypothetical protein
MHSREGFDNTAISLAVPHAAPALANSFDKCGAIDGQPQS